MKKIASFLLAMSLLFSLTACKDRRAADKKSAIPDHAIPLCTEHRLSAEKESKASDGYSGSTQTVIHFGSTASYAFSLGSSAVLTEILRSLEYAPEKLCRCMYQYTVDTKFGLGYEINLTEGFARFGDGQADLTQGQIEALSSIITWASEQCKQEVSG